MNRVKLLYSDENFAAFHKPEGMLVHRSSLDGRAKHFLLQEARNIAGRRLWPIHRLDRPTSGIVLFAADEEAARRGAELFRDRLVERTYLAVVRGWTPPEGSVDRPLADDLGGVWNAPEREGKVREARTEYRRLATAEIPFQVSVYPTARYSLVDIRPVTGRRRQIRRHFKHIFHPLVGDTTYGEGRHNRFFRDHFGCFRLMLAAVKISLPHPFTGKRLEIYCPPSESFMSVARALGWEEAALREPQRGPGGS